MRIFSKFSIVSLALFLSLPIYAHTINQQIEELYGQTYLPLFILAKVLPFIGLGLIAYKTNEIKKWPQVRYPFLVALFIGITIGMAAEVGNTAMIVNTLSPIIIGILILFVKNTANKKFDVLFILMGISLGIEHGMMISHAHEIRWLFISLLALGFLLFITLNNIHLIGNPKRKIAVYTISLFMILFGIGMVLLT